MSEQKPPSMSLKQGGGVSSPVGAEVLEMVMKDTPDFLVQTDKDGVIRYINQIFESHDSPDNVLGLHCTAFLMEASRSVLEETLEWTQRNKKVKVVELEMEVGAWLQSRVFPIFRKGKFFGHLLISSDITPLKTAQAQLAEANVLLQARVQQRERSLIEETARRALLESSLVRSQRLESLGALAGGIAHEYNNLLTVILGNAGLAQMLLPKDSQAREAIRHLETATVHAAELTNQLLTYSGQARVKTERLDLSQAISELSVLVEAILKGGKSLDLHCEADLPPVLGDLGQVQQMLMHLVRQAADNLGAEAGAIRVETGLVNLSSQALAVCVLQEGLQPGEMVFLRVSDTGKRLTAAECRYFFDPFSLQSKSSHTKGLSMAAVLGIVRSYGGTCHVSSTESVNQVTLYFPVRARNEEQLDTAGCHLLLVDDELAVRGTMGSLLDQLGYAVCCVESGQAALDYFEAGTCQTSAVLLDANMPGMRGVVCFDAIREIHPDIPIVVMSGFSEDQIRAEFAGRVLQGVLRKPFRFPELERIVLEIVGAP